jgi:hypothetical protein
MKVTARWRGGIPNKRAEGHDEELNRLVSRLTEEKGAHADGPNPHLLDCNHPRPG